jgi:hypothetical protein
MKTFVCLFLPKYEHTIPMFLGRAALVGVNEEMYIKVFEPMVRKVKQEKRQL